MSEDVTKTAVRVGPLGTKHGVPLNMGIAEELEFFQALIGKPDEVDYNNGTVAYYKYSDYSIIRSNKGEYFIDILTNPVIESFEHPGLQLSLVDAIKLADPIVKNFDIGLDMVYVCSYTWYNGVDEPDPSEVG